jgi:hypothetical protein
MTDRIGNPLDDTAQSGIIGRRPTVTPRQSEPVPPKNHTTPNSAQAPARVKRTLMFTPQRAKWLKVQAAQEGREMSDIVEEALATYQQLHP